MDLLEDSIIDELYNNVVVANITESEEYQENLKQYNKILENIENEELKQKLIKLKELINSMVSDSDRTTFKIGFSLGVKMVIEALNNNNIK